jgi:hypothetical protein
VNVIREIDEGWWEGEIQNTGRRGMFPSNYCEYCTHLFTCRVISAGPPRPPIRRPSNNDLKAGYGSQIALAPSQPANNIFNDPPQQHQQLQPQTQYSQHSSRQVSVASSSHSRQGSLQSGINVMPRSSVSSAASAAAADNTGPCSTCGCTDYRANAFKPGQCITCYHKH